MPLIEPYSEDNFVEECTYTHENTYAQFILPLLQ